MSGSVTLIRGDARQLALADASVDLIVTSPPYFALRSYTDGGEHYAGQIGSEATPAEFVAALVECTREWMRVLKPTGSIWVNLGDKYSTGNSGQSGMAKLGEQYSGGGHSEQKAKRGMPSKSLLGLPWRYALACIDELGLILRAEVIWSKPNGLPESVTDRVRRSHEQWFHFVKQPRYFSAVDEIREPYPAFDHVRRAAGYDGSNGQQRHGFTTTQNRLGKLPGSVWEIASQPLTVPKELGVDHFAAFPMEWPRRIILGWSPSGICVECGEGRRPVHDGSEKVLHRPSGAARLGDFNWTHQQQDGTRRDRIGNVRTVHRITGYICACPEPDAPTRPSVIVDPFGGTGTTALVASVLGRHGISVDMSADYCRLAAWRITDAKQIERAKRPNKPRPITPPSPEPPAPITAMEWLAHFGLESS